MGEGPIWLTDETWVISDTHWGHDNIVRYCNRPEDHDFLMTLYWNSVVRPGDHVLHLGDVAWHNYPIPMLTGNVHFVPGNHDAGKNLKRLTALGWERLPRRFLWQDGVAFSHEPLRKDLATWPWTLNVHGHIHDQEFPDGLVPGRGYVNVGVEDIGYAPVRLGDVLAGRAGRRR